MRIGQINTIKYFITGETPTNRTDLVRRLKNKSIFSRIEKTIMESKIFFLNKKGISEMINIIMVIIILIFNSRLESELKNILFLPTPA